MPDPRDGLIDAVLAPFLGCVDFKVGASPLLGHFLGQLPLDSHLRLCILVECGWGKLPFFDFWEVCQSAF